MLQVLKIIRSVQGLFDAVAVVLENGPKGFPISGTSKFRGPPLGALIADRANQKSVELIIPKRKEVRSRGVRVTAWGKRVCQDTSIAIT
jgi:hypothetical protein